jgi:hypothetical protein
VRNKIRLLLLAGCRGNRREAYPAASEAVRGRLFTARLNACPSLGSLYPSLLGSVKISAMHKLANVDLNRRGSATTLYEPLPFPFVIPSEAEGSAALRTTTGNAK